MSNVAGIKDDTDIIASIYLFIEGEPACQGNLQSMPYRKSDGKLGVRVYNKDKDTIPYREKVERKMREYISLNDEHFIKDDPISVECSFYFPVPNNKVTKKRGYPLHKTTAKDLDKLFRLIGDALTNATGVDDARIVHIIAKKQYVYEYKDVGVSLNIVQFKQEYEGGIK